MSGLIKGLACCLLYVIGQAGADAAAISRFSPQGEVAQVRQVRASFSEPAIQFGDPKAPAPFDVNCAEAGTARWADDKNWIFDFVRDLPPGTKCSFTLKPGFKTLAGNTVSGKSAFQFNTGGPAVLNVHPYQGESIDEEQAFILIQNGAATEASVREHLYCEIEGVHERVPVKSVAADIRTQLLKRFADKIDASRVTIVQCQQRFPNEAAVRLVWDKGISTASGIATMQAQSFKFKTRKAFTASFSCQRENANTACTPILPVSLSFSSPISRKMAEDIVLKGARGTAKPDFAKDDKEEAVYRISFKPPFAEKAEYSIVLPGSLKDESGRALSNAAQFPLKFTTADFPPLAKFPSAPFGIIELNADATLPVTLRNVESSMMVRSASGKASPGTVADVKVDSDAGIIAWLGKLNRYHESSIQIAGKPVETRSIGLLEKEPGARKLDLPPPSDSPGAAIRPFEVIGIPFKDPGFHVVELESRRLGAALLGKSQPMYVRTSVLVTNLAVHLKLGRENAAVWVTTLDNAKPVADADVRISDCKGKELWRGKTDKNGLAISPKAIEDVCQYSDSREDRQGQMNGLFASARKIDEKGRADMAFALSSWNSGIESFRFNLPTDVNKSSTVRAHTIFDRTLLRAGETVSMKHVIRVENMHGFALQRPDLLPDRVRIIHQGSNQEFQFPLTWRGQNSAVTEFAIPRQAKLGRYDVVLDKGKPKTDAGPAAGAGDVAEQSGIDGEDRYSQNTYMSGSFRVEEFRLPLLQGRITPPKPAQISPKEMPLDVQLNYLNGGGASGLSVEITSLLRNKFVSFPAYQEFSFAASGEYDDEQRIVANKLPVSLDKNGGGKTVIKDLPAISKPQELLSEMSYADPNGEVQTVSAVTPVWPSALVLGVKAGEWVSVKKKMTLTAVALDTSGKPQADVKVEFSGIAKQTNSHRKRMVGGFYAYENAEIAKDLGTLCSGKSDARGLVLCDVELAEPGNVEVFARAKDGKGKLSQARTSVWVTRQGEIWFDGENQDRMDILPEKKRYQAGETAKFQVRMPFRHATALVAVEREGIIDTMVVQLNGRDPTVSLPVKASYGPNVFVSVLAVRGRMREVPWYSFFTWGWKEPINWWHEFREYQAPGALVDLSKPAYKYGIAEIGVGIEGSQLGVTVASDKASYPIRSTAKVSLQVLLPGGKPAAGAEVAVAAVDEALLELQPNTSWDLLNAMLQRRSYGIETATAQMQVIGKRHYGRKAVAAGGGGGKAPTRELFDTLLLWKPNVVLDANGRAQLDVPLNDALTSFRIVAVAQNGASLFGTGSTSIRSTQDLQLISGLPPLVREGDRYNAALTVRNTTARAMQVNVAARVGGLAAELPSQNLNIPAGEARELSWSVTAPVAANGDVQQLAWEVRAQEQGGQAVRDSLKFSQRVVPAVPVTVQQASLFQLDKAESTAITQPADSLPGRGGLAISLMPSLAGPSEGLRRFFADYPYSCLEQKASKAIGLRDAAMWDRVMSELPTYLDSDGLAYYYPPKDAGQRLGSDTLTAYILAASQEAGYALPEQSRDKMLRGLAAFVEGKVTRDFWSPKKDLDVRKIAALEALSRYGQMDPRMLGSIQISPNLWPTSTLLDWMEILQRVASIPQHDRYQKEVDQILRSRLNYQGTRMGFSTESDDYWWWLMWNGDANANRLILATLDSPAWREDMPKLINGAIQRQQRGHWASTTANVWGTLALEKFAQKFEAEKVSGTTRAALANASLAFNWPLAGGGKLSLPWPAKALAPATASQEALKLTHDGRGKPWVSLQSLAAVPLKMPFSSGYRIIKTLVPVEQKEKGKYSRGDIVRVELEVDAQADMTWVVVSDPVPAGASLLGSGLGRDSAIAASGERSSGRAWVAYEERSFEAYRSYYEFVPKGKFKLSYTMRLNNAGEFNLPQTRVEAMYASEMFGEIPNATLNVK
ncbi:MG2 domain-containing protein [Undibacterium sp.]|jgi:uncharacterized protein YfaS (alpha-2-macroglobulin family)|uniref:alpha-2-macroglobulin family protein n=1 Tax=Undibacterium sp. TaxID=1914977 RepID=UPI002CFD4663|nr:MG2 domain-containing protein [Undibacterium sp.]HTD06696.1 MG2 domain-containing protein [Undibacterium sp.]